MRCFFFDILQHISSTPHAIPHTVKILCDVVGIEYPRPHDPDLAHLQAAFPHDDCPIAAFQQALRVFFI